MNYKSNHKKEVFYIISFVAIVPGFFLFAYYWLPRPNSRQDTLERSVEAPESKVRGVIHEELRLYKETGRFSTNSNFYLTDYEKNSKNYSIKIKPSQNRLIVSVVSIHASASYSAFGVIKILKANISKNDNTTENKWQYLEAMSFVCEGEKNAVLPNDLEMAKITRKCPLNYNLTYDKKKNIKNIEIDKTGR